MPTTTDLLRAGDMIDTSPVEHPVSDWMFFFGGISQIKLKGTNWRADFITHPFPHLLLSGQRQFEQVWQKVSRKPTNKEATVQNKHWSENNDLVCLHANHKSFEPPRSQDLAHIKEVPFGIEIQRGRTVSSW